jgi:hypothetical protein
VPLRGGDERHGLDFPLIDAEVLALGGEIVSSVRALPPELRMSVSPKGWLGGFGLALIAPKLSVPPGADGRFRITEVLPGSYTITVQARAGAAGSIDAEWWYAITDVEVAGANVGEVRLVLERAPRITGTVRAVAGRESAGIDVTACRVRLAAVEATTSGAADGSLIGDVFVSGPPAVIAADGTFAISDRPPGLYRFDAVCPDSWWLRSAMIDDVDTLDSDLETRPGGSYHLSLTLTNQRTLLAGVITTPDGHPAADVHIITIPADHLLWRGPSRRIKWTRPSSDGAFEFQNLPAGNYLLIATTDVEPNEWNELAFIASVAPHGVPVIIRDGTRTIQNLHIKRPRP